VSETVESWCDEHVSRVFERTRRERGYTVIQAKGTVRKYTK